MSEDKHKTKEGKKKKGQKFGSTYIDSLGNGRKRKCRIIGTHRGLRKIQFESYRTEWVHYNEVY